MAINTLEFAEKLTGELDRMIVQKRSRDLWRTM